MSSKKRIFALTLGCALTAYSMVVVFVVSWILLEGGWSTDPDELLFPVLVGLRLDCAFPLNWAPDWVEWVMAVACWLVYLVVVYLFIVLFQKKGVHSKLRLYLCGSGVAVLVYLPWFLIALGRVIAVIRMHIHH
ncbi:hypothetical protein PDESU_00378 [Pontiella desulfatans]|uniref:Uncharacterized protein n=1 Tax=Pontiella desulfatans TaxID=2750659 RepID=A0A6C2TWX9_PONDE|nr:hypothetical protein [Pontiella desulfatans]VGO11831.1 hypothetical protein PDESU_00378 [Pontiella desulfatans]